MDIQPVTPSPAVVRYRFPAIALLVAFMTGAVVSADAQQVVPFGDVPATEKFPDAEIASRGRQQDRPLTYAPWRKLCFKATRNVESKLVCRTTIDGKFDTGQIAIRVDLTEREGDPVVRLQIFVPPGSLLQPGVKLTVDQGASLQVPYVICLTNICVAGSVATDSLVHDLETGRTLAVETVNFNLMNAISSLPLKQFAEVYRGAPAEIFEQRLDGDWKN
jgi:invasion protein IalB